MTYKEARDVITKKSEPSEYDWDLLEAAQLTIDTLESSMRELIREGNRLIEVAQQGLDESAQETAALDWCDTVDDALALGIQPRGITPKEGV